MGDAERVERMELAGRTVAACLRMLADSELDHEDAPLVLHMLAGVLERPEVLA